MEHATRPLSEMIQGEVAEGPAKPGDEPSDAKFADVQTMVMGGGRERTEAEYRALFATAGFRLTRVIPTQSPEQFSVIEAVRVEA